MIKNPQKSFTLTEVLIVTSIIAIITSFVFIAMSGTRAASRDSKRVTEVDSIRAGLEYYYYDNKEYPESLTWIKIEQDEGINGPFAQAMKKSQYLPIIPRDPRYGEATKEGEPYSYQYISTEDKKGYKIHVELEGGEQKYYEVYSAGGSGIVYTGGGGGPTGPPAGYALRFDGIDDYVMIPDSNSLDVSEEITVEAWIKANSVIPRPDWSPVAIKKCGLWECYGILVTEEQSYLYFFVQTGSVSFAGDDIQTGEWLHVAGSWDRVSPNNIDLYFNGVKLGEGPVSTGPISVSDLPLYIGGGTGSASYCPYYFDGIIDEVRVYAKRLPESLIALHYQGDFSGDSVACSGDCDLRGLWRFEEGFGVTTVDSSGKGNDGTLINNPQWVIVP